MDLIDEIFRTIKEEILETVQSSTETAFTFQTSLKFPKQSQVLPTKDTSKKKIIESFYKVSELAPLEIYVDNIEINYKEIKLYDREIENCYFKYSREWGGFPIVIPCILGMDLFHLICNNVFIFPFVQLKYMNNPAYYKFYINIALRKSMVS